MAIKCGAGPASPTDNMATQPLSPPAETFDVNVKDFHGHSVVIQVNTRWDVAQVKEEIARKTGIPLPDFKLVFAGQTLADNQTLWVSQSSVHMSAS